MYESVPDERENMNIVYVLYLSENTVYINLKNYQHFMHVGYTSGRKINVGKCSIV